MRSDGAIERDDARLARGARARRTAAVVTIGLCIGVAIYVYSTFGFDLDPRTLRARIADFGWLAPAAYVVAASLRFFLGLPSGVVMSAGGLLFGVWGGLVWGFVGFMASALLSFGIARGLGRDAVAARLRGRGRWLDDVVTRRGAPWMALYTAVPVSGLTPVHMAAGLSGPRLALYCYFGDAVADGEWGKVAASLAVIGVLGALGSVAVRRYGASRPLPDAAGLDGGEERP